MMFDGRQFALQKASELVGEIAKLKKKGVAPKLASIVIGDEGGGRLYQSLKKKAAERIGAKVEIKSLSSSINLEEVVNLIKKLNADKLVHGIMVQLPLPKKFSQSDRDKIISAIAKEKDVDGLRDDSPYLAPAVKAVLAAIKETPPLKVRSYKVVVVGAEGFVGQKIVKVLKGKGYQVDGVDIETKDPVKPQQGWSHRVSLKLKTKNADILISATGREGLITGNMVKSGAVVIDVGSPKGDVKFDEVVKKASFMTPVPGGIGPVTISCLLENLVEAASS